MSTRDQSKPVSYTLTESHVSEDLPLYKDVTSIIFDTQYSGSTFKIFLNSLSVTPLGFMTMLAGYGVYDHFGTNNQDMILKILGLALALVALIFILLS